MLKSPLRTLFAVLLAAGSGVPALHAQSQLNLKMKVPFAFQYGEQRLAPGTYRMNMMDPYVMQLQSGSHSARAMVSCWIEPGSVRTGHALFRKHGDRYFLEEIWAASSGAHLRIYQSVREKRADRELESEGEGPAQVQLSLLETSALKQARAHNFN